MILVFTGIVEEVGRVAASRDRSGNRQVTIEADAVIDSLKLGDSVACGGACLTVTDLGPRDFTVELSRESVARTAPRWEVGASMNLERAMRADGRFGGHLVTGHVDGTGVVQSITREPGAHVLEVRTPTHLSRYLAPKGSITLDGVSLTVVDARPNAFSVWLIPHTLEVTTLGQLEPGAIVNLEADLLAKYLERLLEARGLAT